MNTLYTDRKYMLTGLPRPGLVSLTLIHFIFIVACLAASRPVTAAIRFGEVTQEAHMIHTGQTYGAAWGDYNGDGWPDLWVGNHNSKPSLYLNNKDGTFTNIVDKVWSGNPADDTHGASWADFDNDGDQDLVELVGASLNDDGTMCIGCGRNHLFINQDGVLVEKAKEYGLAHNGLARSPLWLDVDHDGKLDLVVVNTHSPGKPPSQVYLQKNNHFVEASKDTGFRDKRWSRRDKALATYRNLKRFKFSTHTALMDVHTHLESAQLARFENNNSLDLALFASPTRIYSLEDDEFDDITSSLVFPRENGISDVAIEDFNGDGKNDLYLMKGPFLESDVIQENSNKIKGTLIHYEKGIPNTIVFSTHGELDIRIAPTWLSLDKVFIGSGQRHPATRSFTLSPDDPGVKSGDYSQLAEQNQGISLIYDPGTALWKMRNFSKWYYIDFIIQASQPIVDLKTMGFKPFKESGVDAILMRKKDDFIPKKLTGDIGKGTSCYSIVAADFDNDMDIDLYMVCTGPVANLPNRLFENDGKGNFRLVPNAGGAAGSQVGRGDVAAVADYDRDGFLDIFVTNGTDPAGPFVADGPHQLFHNLSNKNHWIEIDLEGVKSNRDGIGASVVVEAGGVKQIRDQRGGMHRITQNDKRIHFGLGNHHKVDRVVIHWPSGIEQEIHNIQADRIIKIREQQGLTTVENKITRK